MYRQVGITIMSKKEKQAIMSVQKMFEIKQRTDRLGLIRRKTHRQYVVHGAWGPPPVLLSLFGAS